MARVIVVGVDGSETAQKAAQTAGTLAAALRARLHVVMAFSSERAEVVGGGSDKLVVSDRRPKPKWWLAMSRLA